MLLNEIATVTNISTARDDDKEAEDRIVKNAAKKSEHKTSDDLGKKRRSKLSQADQFRDIARQIRNNPNND